MATNLPKTENIYENRENEIIGISEKGKELRAPKDCFMVFPNQNAEPGQEWFYLGEQS